MRPFFKITFFLITIGGMSGCDEPTPSFKEDIQTSAAGPETNHDDQATPQAEDATAQNAQDDGNSAKSADEETTNNTGDPLVVIPATIPKSFEAIEKEFLSSSIQDGEIDFRLDQDQAEFFLTMGRVESRQSIEYTQESRERVLDTFLIGTDAREGRETFTQSATPTGLLDILLVIDNSGSMAEEQINLSTKLSKLLTFIADSQWRISVETTDPNDTCGQFIIDKNDANTEAAFAAAVTRGTSGSGNERGILQAVNGLKCSGSNWMRANSTIAVLILSDENNCSDGNQCSDQPWEKSTYLTDYLAGIRAMGTNARVYGLIWHPSDLLCAGAARMGTIYAEAVTSSNGSWGSVCDTDYSSTLQSISQNLGTILETQFPLKFPVKPDSALVAIDGIVQTSGYSIDKNVLVFETAPTDGSTITVEYDYEITSPSKTFVLSKTKDIDEIAVYIDSTKLTSDEFTYNQEKATIELNELPQGKEIKVSYLSGVLTNTNFPLGADIKPYAEKIEVFVNDILAEESEWTLLADSVYFFEPPKDGAKVRVIFTTVGGPQLEYPLEIPEDSRENITVKDLKEGSPIEYKVDGNRIVFDIADYTEGRSIVIKYPMNKTNDHTLDVGSEVVTTLPVEVFSSDGTKCTDGVKVTGSVIDFASCQFKKDEKLKVKFSYRTEQILDFIVIEEIPEIGMEGMQWQVFVNGKETTSYVTNNTEGISISFENLPDGSLISVKVSRAEG